MLPISSIRAKVSEASQLRSIQSVFFIFCVVVSMLKMQREDQRDKRVLGLRQASTLHPHKDGRSCVMRSMAGVIRRSGLKVICKFTDVNGKPVTSRRLNTQPNDYSLELCTGG